MVFRTILFILLMTKNLQTDASGFDAYSSCYRTSRKRQELPCDFGSQSWCTIPGNSYPWHAVRRFVHENQGLMRRMYGDERHISVLRAELESNDIEFFNSPTIKEEFRKRYSKEFDGTDGTKEFVKILIKSEGRKFADDANTEKPNKFEKIQKSFEETSNNVLYQNQMKNPKEEDSKGPPAKSIANKTGPKTTTPPNTMETTLGVFTSETSVNYTTTEATNSTSYNPTNPTTQPTSTTEGYHYNFTTSDLNDTQVEESSDYELDTEEPLTTTSFDDFTTTESYFEEDEIPKDKSEIYADEVEEVVKQAEETVNQETAEEPVSPQPSPMIRLKGINACPVKEEVVAPFWANNTRGEVLALLNLYPFEQYVHWEKCTYEHKQMFCREGCRCEQQYRLHRLLAYDPNNECRGIFSDWFRFPSCCVCKCYDLPMEFRLTSRSPRFQNFDIYGKESIKRFQKQP